MSQNLGTTLARASDLASFMGSVEVSLEHVLLALCDDPDAEAVLTASRVDVQHLKAETHGYLNSLPRLPSGAGFSVSQALSRILEAAAAAARGSRRRDINGAIVLAAIVGEGRSAAAQILQVHGLTFDEAIRALQAALAAPARESLPDIRPTDDVLARARERVQSRAAPSLREMMKDAPRPIQPPPPPPPPTPAPPQMAPQSESTLEAQSPAPIVEMPPVAASTEEPTEVALPSIEGTMPTGDAGPSSDPGRVEEVAIELPEPKLADPAIEGGDRIEPTLPGTISANAPEAHAEQIPSPDAPQSAGPRPAQATDFGYPPAPPLVHPPAPVAAPSIPFDLQRPAPIAVPPPIPPMPPQGSPVFRGGPPTGFGAPRPPFAQSGPPPFPQPSPGPSMRGDPRATPPLAPYDPSRPPLPGGPTLGPYGNTGGAGAPSARDLHMPHPPSQMAQGQPQAQRAARPKIEVGQLAENIPRAMRVDRTESVEVRIGKAAAKAITQGLEGGGVAWRHEVTVTQAMSVRLRAPDGGFFIETASPETQWIENNLGLGSDDFASWRFHITPQFRGWSRLQIIVSARTIGSDGMAAETALPDQLVDVKVKTNYKRAFARWTGWTLAAIVGGILAKFGEGTFSVLLPLAEKLMK